MPVKINVKNDAEVASELKISLLEVKSDTALAGNFPMEGNAFTIASVDLGEIDVKPSGDAPIASLNAGDKDVRLAKFDFEIKSEAQIIKKIVFTQDGTVADTDLANLKLVDEDGTVLALGEMNKGELAFDLNKDCISGTTARLTIRGDVVGGAGRTIKFSIDNVNNVQSVGKVYGTTIVASGTTEDLEELKIESGAFIIGKASSSPAAATVAATVDDQKFAAIKIEAIGEPIQLETVFVAIRAPKEEILDSNNNPVVGTAIREIKLVNNGVVVASQEIKQNYFEKKNKVQVNGKELYVDNVDLPLSEIVTVEPNSPITLDILVDLKEAAENITYELGLCRIDASGLVSEKDIYFNKEGTEDISYGNVMTVGDVKVTLEQKAQVNGYVFPNQSEEVLAEFNIKHNLGETVRLSALKVKIDKNGVVDDAASNASVKSTFKNIKLVSSSGKVISETIVNPATAELTIPLKEGVTVESGKTIRLGLMADIRSGAQPGNEFKFAAIDASAVTISTGTTVNVEKSDIDDSRLVTVAAGADENSVNATESTEKLKDKNVVANTNNVEIARWKLTNKSKEAVGVNKVYLTATYGGQTIEVEDEDVEKLLQKAYVQCVLKDDKGNVLTDTSEPFTLNKDKSTEIEILKDGNRSKFVIDAATDDVYGEKELILYATIAEGAQVGGTISVELGKVNGENDVDLFEITGRISGITATCKVDSSIPSGNETTIAVSKVVAKPISIASAVTENVYGTGIDAKYGVKGQTVGKFSITNEGKTSVGVNQIVLRVAKTSNINGEITKLGLYDSDGKLLGTADIKEGNTITSGDHQVEGAVGTFKPVEKYVVFVISDARIKVAANDSEEFIVRTDSEELLETGSEVSLFVDKSNTCTDKASFDGYNICLDNDKDVELTKVVIQRGSRS